MRGRGRNPELDVERRTRSSSFAGHLDTLGHSQFQEQLYGEVHEDGLERVCRRLGFKAATPPQSVLAALAAGPGCHLSETSRQPRRWYLADGIAGVRRERGVK